MRVINKKEDSENKIVLLGNSHAQMYVPLVSEVLSNDSNLLLLPLNECLPTTLINVSKECCLHLANKNLSSVLKDEKVTTIAIATTWYAQGYIDTNGLSVSRNNLKFAWKISSTIFKIVVKV